ncbi:MAG TPA: hypothetical protein VJN18_13795 [Polyangiaceae bacterium]|nr:hypothetical protein [Polyangiaceae bacterium]
MEEKKMSREARGTNRWLAASKWVGVAVVLLALVPSTSHAGLAFSDATCTKEGVFYRCRGTFAGFRARTGVGANDFAVANSLKVAGFPVEVVFKVTFDGILRRCVVPTSVPSTMITALITGSASGSNRWFEVRWNDEASGTCDRIWIEGGSPY